MIAWAAVSDFGSFGCFADGSFAPAPGSPSEGCYRLDRRPAVRSILLRVNVDSAAARFVPGQ